jgi:predicted ATPase
MGQAISKLTIKGYKSIRNLENFELRNINILIGPNGSGKSNFVEFFRIMEEIAKGGQKSLDRYVKRMAGADKLLFLGAKVTPFIEVEICTADDCSPFELEATVDDRLEYIQMPITGTGKPGAALGEGVYRDHKLYHFHDTSDFAAVKRPCSKRDYEYLRPDASNLAAFLLFLRKKHEKGYRYIREVIQLAAPFFDDFWLREEKDKDDILLEWIQKGSDYPFHPSQISDGTLRFICLATALLQPDPPSTILLDEPELGLHPYALTLLAGLIQKASIKAQVIVATQSAALIDHFQPEDIILVERKNEESVFDRPDTEKLKIWLEDYSLGDIWSRNIIEGKRLANE